MPLVFVLEKKFSKMERLCNYFLNCESNFTHTLKGRDFYDEK